MSIRNPFKSIEDSIKRSFNKLGDEIKKSFVSAGDEIKSNIEHTANTVKHDIDHEAKKALNSIKKEAKSLEHTAGDLVQSALDDLAKAITKEGLTKVHSLAKSARSNLSDLRKDDPTLVDAIDGLSFSLKLGPCTLNYSNFYGRSEELILALDGFIERPPAFHRQSLIFLIDSLGPTSVNLGVSVQFALVIGSNELGVGAELSDIPLKLFTRLGDRGLAALGVPE